jgi:hypothetical protein
MVKLCFWPALVTAVVSAWASVSAGGDPPSASRLAEPIRTGESRYDWKWVAARYDKDGDGAVTSEELGASADFFARLDRSWDGTLTPDDFDWSAKGALDQRKETALSLFRSADPQGDGRISLEEWQSVFANAAGEKGYLTDEDVERLVYLPAVVRGQRQREGRARRSEQGREAFRLAKGGPALEAMAPDFELRSPDGATTVRLSAHRGDKPVALIFGSFT